MRLRWLVLLPFIIGVFISCGNNNNGAGKQAITIAGSTSVMPFTEKLAEHFMIDNKDATVDVQGGGSTAGVQATINRTVDIGMSSRELKENEKILNRIIICYDGIAVIVHRDNPVTVLTLDQIRRIFSGSISNWQQLGWVNRKIDAVSREEGSGTRGAFEDLIMKGKEIDDATMVQDSNGSVKEVVATDPYAIGYMSMGLVDKKVKPVAINDINPSINTIKSGNYKIVRPFLYLTNGQPNKNTGKFIDYVLSRDGQHILKNEGLVGIHD
ncbi:MAG: phosphate binding protein [Deltaproteobacteria bacterium]|nr:phosphate binding protein [Deltaproteobacteria bacterium]